METTKTNDALFESARVAEKWFNESNSAMMEIYNKQLNLVTNFYSNYINSMMGGAKNMSSGQNFADNYFSGNIAKWLWNPYSSVLGNNNSNPFLMSFDKMYKQLMDFNRDFYTEFNNKMKSSEIEWASISNDYKETMEKRLEASKKILSTMSDTYNKQLNFSIETEKNMIEEINNQFNTITKQNQKFWSDVLQSYQITSNGEEKKSKEQHTPESKKHSHVSVAQ